MLREWRERRDLSRRRAAVHLDVAERTIVRWEDPADDALPPADQFLRLVAFYSAQKDLVKLMGRWERAARAAEDAAAG